MTCDPGSETRLGREQDMITNGMREKKTKALFVIFLGGVRYTHTKEGQEEPAPQNKPWYSTVLRHGSVFFPFLLRQDSRILRGAFYVHGVSSTKKTDLI